MLHVDKSQGLNKVKHYDWLLLLIVLALNAFGIIIMWSVSKHLNNPSLLIKQGAGVCIGFVCMLILSLIDYKDLRIL